jgi:flagellar biosynthetic protein FlhB
VAEGGQEQAQEKTQEPTPRRLQKAREKGQVPRSRELNTAAVTLSAAAFLIFFGAPVADGLARIARDGFVVGPRELVDPASMWRHLVAALLDAMLALAPFLVVTFVVAALSPLLLGGWSFSWEAVQPKLEKIDPVKGLKRVFGPRGLMEFAKAFVKFVVLAAGAAVLIQLSLAELVGLGMEPGTRALAHAADLLGRAFLMLSLGLLLIAAIDVPFQLWQHTRDLRMTHQEVRDEAKETEGRPEVLGQRRKRQRELAQGRMMQKVPEADVVVTNPTHYAVALQYERGSAAPRVVAKGTDLVALRIRELAASHDVPLFEAPAVARTLHAVTEVDQEIPASLYMAVAQILAYVYRLDEARRTGRSPPVAPTQFDVPDEPPGPA